MRITVIQILGAYNVYQPNNNTVGYKIPPALCELEELTIICILFSRDFHLNHSVM